MSLHILPCKQWLKKTTLLSSSCVWAGSSSAGLVQIHVGGCAVSELSWDDPDAGSLSPVCVCVTFNETTLKLFTHSLKTAFQEDKAQCKLKILPVLHLLRSLLIKSGHMATPCIGEGGKPTQASLTQVMNLVGSMSVRVYHRLPYGLSDSCVKYTYLLSRPSKSHPYRVPTSAPEISICIRSSVDGSGRCSSLETTCLYLDNCELPVITYISSSPPSAHTCHQWWRTGKSPTMQFTNGVNERYRSYWSTALQ